MVVHRHVLLDDRGGIRMGDRVSVADYVVALKAELLDACYLQQNAFDPVDGATSAERQRAVFGKLWEVLSLDLAYDGKEEAREGFLRATELFRTWNYAASGSEEYERAVEEIDRFIQRKGRRRARLEGA